MTSELSRAYEPANAAPYPPEPIPYNLASMSANDSIVALLKDILAPLGGFQARRMFGGLGLYLDGVFFAILNDGELYVRVSDRSRPDYKAEGMKPFTYATKQGEKAIDSYWRVPERLFDEPDEMIPWVRASVEAARTVAAAKAHPKRSPPRKKTARKAPGRGLKSSK